MSFHFRLIFLAAIVFSSFTACNDEPDVAEKEIVTKPEDINKTAADLIRTTLREIIDNSKNLPDSFKIKNPVIVQALYEQKAFQPIWSTQGAFVSHSDSLYQLIGSGKNYGLFPDDYYFTRISNVKAQLAGIASTPEKKLDASTWAYLDMLMTSAFVQVVKDLKIGRLLPDSVVKMDSTFSTAFFSERLKSIGELSNEEFTVTLEPVHADYWKIREALLSFLDSGDFKKYTKVVTKDSAQLKITLQKRLSEEDTVLQKIPVPDSIQLAEAIRRSQKRRSIKTDGKISTLLISKLNDTDNEKFIRVAITLDRYKQLQPLPEQYIWVNLPSYYLQLRERDSVALKSRVVIGKPITRTPIITSAISDLITYPQWTIPESIIRKEILPGLQKNAGYTNKKGYSLIDKDGNVVDPYSVDWSKYKTYIPYKVVQGSGDDNALGVLKFNFPNKFSVYLHDTNQRYLFSRAARALSHGCVRVQAWNDLAKYILRNDSMHSARAIPVDSMQTWLAAKQKRYIPVRKPIPLFIRYFTCDVSGGKLVFYDDIYGEDRKLRDTIFSNK